MTILVTGANGYLGCGITKVLVEQGNTVIAADIDTGNVHCNAQKKNIDIFQLKDPYSYFGMPDVLLHLAWRNGFVHNDASHFEDLPHHYMFIKRMIDGGIKRVCVMGSMHEIGFFEGSIDEHTPCNPQTLYGIAKNALRQSVQQYAIQKNVQFIWLRGFYIVGNNSAGASIFSKIVQAAQTGQKEFPFTTGQNQYDFLDYDVFCSQVAAAVSQENVSGIINICSGHPEKLKERVERFIQENGYDIHLQYGCFPDRPYDSKAIWGNDAKIRMIIQAES